MHISALTIYPVKSLGPVALGAADVTTRGLAGDRRWMIVDADGRFVTRREMPVLARIGMRLCEGGYALCAAEGEAVLPTAIVQGARAPVTVWDDRVPALVVENDASHLISTVAGRELRFAYMPDETVRAINPAYSRVDEAVSFADGFPILVTTEASLIALNAALETPAEMARFRPNVVLSGAEAAWVERGWSGVAMGDVHLRLTKPCARCIVITQQPETGERHEGNALPMALRRLGQYNAEGALFGMNAVPERVGRISLGDAVSAA